MIGCFLIDSQALNDWTILSPIIACFTWHFLIPMHLGSGLGLALVFGVGLGLVLGLGLGLGLGLALGLGLGLVLHDFSTIKSSVIRFVPDLYRSGYFTDFSRFIGR